MKVPPANTRFWAGALTAGCLVALGVVVSVVVSLYVEDWLLPGLARDVGLRPDVVRVRRIGWFGADLGPIRLLRGQAPALAVSAIQIDYTPLSLLRGRVAGITLLGLEVDAHISSQGITIAGRDVPLSSPPPDGGAAYVSLAGLLPIDLARISIVDARVRVDGLGRQMRIPVEAHLRTDRLADGILAGRISLSLLGNRLLVTVAVDEAANHARLDLTAEAVSLEKFAPLVPREASVDLHGKAAMKGWVSGTLHPAELTELSVAAQLENAQVATPQGWLRTLDGDADADRPLVITLAGEGLSALAWSCAPFEIGGPLRLVVNALGGRLALSGKSWSLAGAMDTLVPKQSLLNGGALNKTVATAWEIAAGRDGAAPDRVDFKLANGGGSPVVIDLGGERGELSLRKQTLEIEGQLEAGALVAGGRLKGEDLRLAAPQGRIQAPLLDITANFRLPVSATGAASAIEAHGQVSALTATADAGSLRLPRTRVDLSGRAQPQRPWRFTGGLHLADGRVEAGDSDINVEKLSLDLPLAWPSPEAGEAGRLAAAQIRWRGIPLGGLGGVLRQTGRGLALDVRHRNTQIPGLAAIVKGRLGPDSARFELLVPPHEMARDLDLGRFIPAAAGILGRARVGAAAEVILDSRGPRGAGRFKINRGRLHQARRSLSLEGIELALQMDDLFQFRSAPRQALRVARLALGEIQAERLAVDLQIENARTLFIETAGLSWCQGRVNTAALRIDPAKADYNLTLYCDRLNLAQLLEQLGAADASGEGSVNGRIPLRWADQRLSFDNGFLYSTPGQSGTIRLSGTQGLLAGLPPGSPQHTQLDIATEALRDYTYQWAKLLLQSEAEMLLLKLQLDGKPNRLLPFAYDQSLGQFKRVAGAGQAEFKGISIDLNFRSPLNEIIHYKDILTPN